MKPKYLNSHKRIDLSKLIETLKVNNRKYVKTNRIKEKVTETKHYTPATTMLKLCKVIIEQLNTKQTGRVKFI